MALISLGYPQQQTSYNKLYEAPLVCGDDPNRMPGLFTVRLRPEHPYEEHIVRIGTDCHVDRRIFEEFYVTKHLTDEHLLAAIRADPGVLNVAYQIHISRDDALRGWR